MTNIEVDFAVFLPSLGVFYNYFEILKEHQFIKEVDVIQTNGESTLRVHRFEDQGTGLQQYR